MTSLHLIRVVPAPPERVWHALTDPAALAAWFWPERLATTVEADPRVGRRFRIASPTAGMAVGGEYTTVEPPKRLSFTWRWDGEADESQVTILLVPVDDGTEITLTHERFPDDDARDNHVQGWTDCLDRLPARLL